MVNGKTQILDCTLRDGGYINNWQFSKQIGQDLYNSVSSSGVEYIELGFIYPSEENLGAGMFKCLTDDYLRIITGDKKRSKIAVMIDFGKFEPNLPERAKSDIDLVRIACHKKDILDTIPMCQEIKKKGFEVSLQLMNFPSYSENELKEVMEKCEFIDYIYIADSFGSIDRKVMDFGFEIMKKYKPKIGFHPHNNIQSAFQNSLHAIDRGVDILDGTILGLGRGAGNLNLELLLLYLSEKTDENYKAEPILDFIEKHRDYLLSMQTRNLTYYQMTGVLGLHPKYAIEADEKNIDISLLWDRLKEIRTDEYKRGKL